MGEFTKRELIAAPDERFDVFMTTCFSYCSGMVILIGMESWSRAGDWSRMLPLLPWIHQGHAGALKIRVNLKFCSQAIK